MDNFKCPLCGEEHPQGARWCPVTGQSLEKSASETLSESNRSEQPEVLPLVDPVELPSFLTEMSPVVVDLEGWMDDETLRRVLEGLVSRNRDGQPRQLIDLLTQEPDNATAWIWLSREARADVEKRACLQKALQLEPEHPAARLAWANLDPLSPAGESWQMPDESTSPFEPDEIIITETLTPEETAAPVVQEEAEPDGPGIEDQEDLLEEHIKVVDLPDEPVVQLVEGEDDPPEPKTRVGNARVFEPLLDTDLPAGDGAVQQDMVSPADLPQPEWQEEAPEPPRSGSAVPTSQTAAFRPRHKVSTSEMVMIAVLVLLLLTNIWTALSIVRLERTVQALETQTADTHTLVTTFQEMVLDLLVRMDIMGQSGP